MPEIRINGKPFRAAEGSSVAAAILQSGSLWVRQSVTGEHRGPFAAWAPATSAARRWMVCLTNARAS